MRHKTPACAAGFVHRRGEGASGKGLSVVAAVAKTAGPIVPHLEDCCHAMDEFLRCRHRDVGTGVARRGTSEPAGPSPIFGAPLEAVGPAGNVPPSEAWQPLGARPVQWQPGHKHLSSYPAGDVGGTARRLQIPSRKRAAGLVRAVWVAGPGAMGFGRRARAERFVRYERFVQHADRRVHSQSRFSRIDPARITTSRSAAAIRRRTTPSSKAHKTG